MKSVPKMLMRLRHALAIVTNTNERFDEMRINQGRILARLNMQLGSRRLQDHEFRVFSQWGEDGILQHLTRVIPIATRSFIEFGVEDFFESNCRFLMEKDNWRGFVIDGSASNIARLRKSYFHMKHDVVALQAFITRENINDLLARSGFEEDLGILSIDLDGIDAYVLQAIHSFRPRILICEYNAVFGGQRKISVPYDPAFTRLKAHHSNLFAGASLAALDHIARAKGYQLVGTNSASNNAFFVRADLVNEHVEALSVEQAFTPSLFRESKDKQGDLTFAGGEARLALLKGMVVFNVETGQDEAL